MQVDEYGAPVWTASGVRCGSHGRGDAVYHESVAAVKVCHQTMYAEVAQQQAEIEAEQRNERYFEDRGWEESLAERAWEDSRGVVQFDEAYRNACPELFADEA
jgi:phage protein D